MKYSLQFSDAIHVLAYIEMFQDTRSLSSEMIASSIETNAANVRKIMSQLKKIRFDLYKNRKTAAFPCQKSRSDFFTRCLSQHRR